MKNSTSFPKGSCSASTSSSMVKNTDSPKGSSSVSRNPPATNDPRIASINEDDLLIQLRGWSTERVLKIHDNDPSLLDDIEPKDIVTVAVLKLGSLYLQKILKDQNPLYFNKIFNATLNSTYPLMFDPEGTNVLQKLYDLCDSNQLKLIVEKILLCPDQLKNAAKNYTGAATLVKLSSVLKIINPLFHSYMFDSLTSEICIDIMRSKPGSYLFASCLKDLEYLQNEILYIRAARHCIALATDASGYASLIALIQQNTPSPYKNVLLVMIADNAVYLSQDPNGSYVIQATLLQDLEVHYKICRNLAGNYLYLSTHTYANHVVQKCVMAGGMEYPILELMYSGQLHLLSKHKVGHYVVQKALTATKSKSPYLYYKLVGQIQPYLEDLQDHPIGRYVVNRI